MAKAVPINLGPGALDATGPGPNDALSDVSGLEVGHHQRLDAPWRTGTTVVLARAGAVGGVAVRGGAPATHETDLLDPGNLVERVQGVVLTGGSSYGLAACGGVMAYLERLGLGWPVGTAPGDVVPILPGAALFDLGRGGDFSARPDAAFGDAAARAAGPGPVAEGNVGAGAGAETGRLVGPALKGGIGTASAATVAGVSVGALVVVNAAGSPVDPATGRLVAASVVAGIAGRHDWPGEVDPAEVAAHFAARGAAAPGSNTVLGVVATDAALDRGEATRFASVAHDGLARSLAPAHTVFDGDTVFSLSTGAFELAVPDGPAAGLARGLACAGLFELGATCLARAVVHALLAAESVPGVPCYRDAFPSAFRAR